MRFSYWFNHVKVGPSGWDCRNSGFGLVEYEGLESVRMVQPHNLGQGICVFVEAEVEVEIWEVKAEWREKRAIHGSGTIDRLGLLHCHLCF
jgi:hypothetical protein